MVAVTVQSSVVQWRKVAAVVLGLERREKGAHLEPRARALTAAFDVECRCVCRVRLGVCVAKLVNKLNREQVGKLRGTGLQQVTSG